jgi:hypothetical protein
VEWSGVEWGGVEWGGVEWGGVEWGGVGRSSYSFENIPHTKRVMKGATSPMTTNCP